MREKTPKQVLAYLRRAKPENLERVLREYSRTATVRGFKQALTRGTALEYLEARIPHRKSVAEHLANRVARTKTERGFARLAKQTGISVDALKTIATRPAPARAKKLDAALKREARPRQALSMPLVPVTLPGAPALHLPRTVGQEGQQQYTGLHAHEIPYLEIAPRLKYVEIEIRWTTRKRAPPSKPPPGGSPPSGLKEGVWRTRRGQDFQIGGLLEACGQVAIRMAKSARFDLIVREFSYPSLRKE